MKEVVGWLLVGILSAGCIFFIYKYNECVANNEIESYGKIWDDIEIEKDGNVISMRKDSIDSYIIGGDADSLYRSILDIIGQESR